MAQAVEGQRQAREVVELSELTEIIASSQAHQRRMLYALYREWTSRGRAVKGRRLRVKRGD